MALSIVIPVLNAAAVLPACVAAVRAGLPQVDPGAEIVVSDGGSADAGIAVAAGLGARVIAGERGRGTQLAAGAAVARGDWLLFVHADTRLAPGWGAAAAAFMAVPANDRRAAAFRFALDEHAPAARRLERMVAWRCRRLGLPYGDQGLLIERAFYESLGGFRPLPLMEDVDIVRRIGRRRLSILPVDAVTSAARFRRGGYLRRSARNLACLGLYFAGVSPAAIRRLYG